MESLQHVRHSACGLRFYPGNPHARSIGIKTISMTSISLRGIALTGCFTESEDVSTLPFEPAASDPRAASPNQGGEATAGRSASGIVMHDTRERPWRVLQVLTTPNPSWLVCHPHADLVYAVNEVDRHESAEHGALQVYRLAPADGSPHTPASLRLEPVATRSLAPGATGPTHVAINPAGTHLLVSCYNGGQFNVFALDADGIPGEVTHAHVPEGRGADPERQTQSHAHHAISAPAGDLWLTCDLGADRVSLMRLSAHRLQTTGKVVLGGGAGVRHGVFHPVEPWIYVITEMHATIVRLVYDPASGHLAYPGELDTGTVADADAATAEDAAQEEAAAMDEPLFDGQLFDGDLLTSASDAGDVSLMPEDFTGERSGAGLVIHPNGQWLYASTRRTASDHPEADSVSAWRIDAETGALGLIGRYTADLGFPRAIALSPTGDALYALNQKGHDIIEMAIDPDSGALGAPVRVSQTQQPTCLVWPEADEQ